MKFFTYLLMSSAVFAIFRTHNSVRRCTTEQEKNFVIRTTATFWLMGFFFLLAFLFLPNKGRVIMMLPVFFLAVTLSKAWKTSRDRLRRRDSERVDFEKIKKIN